ncbi:MAG: hypothetical protein ACRDPL_14975, partial [Propionibacteriaceae bacterium]
MVDRPATGAMINLGNLLAHKLDAAFGACPPLVLAGRQRPPLPCQRAMRLLDDAHIDELAALGAPGPKSPRRCTRSRPT